MSDIKAVSANLSIGVFVDCPHCDNFINLMDAKDTDGFDLNDEGHVVSQACPDGSWHSEHAKFCVDSVKCTECNGVFNVKGLEW